VVALDPETARSRGVVPLEALLERAGEVTAAELDIRRKALRINDLATVMYTSGTTGTPKGIMFSHRNIVHKRFCRALALPEIGEHDRFLCYLPLFHTFGRYLEMTGCVFWGATYCFADSPSVEALSRQMRRLEATVFISIPMKWMQLYDLIRQEVDVEADPDDAISRAVRSVAGGGLRWGLSAAGYLDPDIFRFFQRNGVELMSGFGMTEATGGITMTPPGRYRDDSLGGALPGIEIALEEDGELKIRGPYVTIGYLDPPDGVSAFDDDGWLHTGDLMEQDADGFIRIIDRKKEIYKNIQGQTIAPQKIENLFRDFEPVGRIFLVGDHRPYNTALIWPNPEFEALDLNAMTPDEVKAHFRSLVVSANSFLAPYERIVDFAIIDRDFDADRGELTAKGTYRRKTIERNFTDRIRLLYRRTTLHVGDAEVTVPNWFFQALGLTTQELRVEGNQLVLASQATRLTIRRQADGQVRVGAARYRPIRRTVDLGELLATPRLWLGNDELVSFAPLDVAHRDRRRRRDVEVEWVARTGPYHATEDDRRRAAELLQAERLDPLDMHLVACLLEADDPDDALAAVAILERAVASADATEADAALRLLRRAAAAESPHVVRRGFRVLALHERPAAYQPMLASFLDRSIPAIDHDTIRQLAEADFTTDQVDAFLAEAERRSFEPALRRTAAPMLRFIAEYGAVHPGRYRPLRAFLIRIAVVAPDSKLRQLARLASAHLEAGFRAWLGAPRRLAVDPETGDEYLWEDVVAFADDIDDDARSRILRALKGTPMLREAAFLFTGGSALRLDDILPGGVWVRHLGTEHGKSVYRLAVRARNRDVFDLALNVARELDDTSIREEVDWLVVCGATRHLPPLVEDFGGWWPDHRMWTEEFIPGDTLDRGLRKLARRGGDPERLQGVWPFAAWSALSAFVGFWERTGRTTEIANASPTNVIVPMHDYHTGARLVSIAARRSHESIASLLVDLKRSVVDPIEAEHHELDGLVGWDIVFSALVENVGEDEGLEMLQAAADGDGLPREVADAARRFVDVVQGRGFLSRRLFFAAKRYRRWARLNPDATPHARARTLREMFDTYGLGALQATSPEVRVRFFRETVFRDAPAPLADGLEDVIGRLRRGELTPDDLSAALADLRARLDLDADDDFFLARLSYPYLQPDDQAVFVPAETGGVQQSEMVVTLEDADGRPYRIRHALTPKEVARLHRMFVSAKLPVVFRPEHRFLVAVNDRGHLMGGLFYEVQSEDHTAHMDKVVVAERFQGQGIAGALIEELSNRLRTAGYTSLTTGFFRPEFFYRFGFTVERRYAGLVRNLESAPDDAS
jgi:acyl-CoA synthetase (AMP-forming)/AMP-acid ligase II/GNAT superfamily N-acetyltransferase